MNQLLGKPSFISSAVLGMDGVITVDDELQIVQLNRNAEVIFGYDELELIGESITKLLPDNVEENARIYADTFSLSCPKHNYIFTEHDGLAGQNAAGKTTALKANIFSITYDGSCYFTILIQNLFINSDDCNSAPGIHTSNSNKSERKDPAAIYSLNRHSSRKSGTISRLGIIEHWVEADKYCWSQEVFEILEIDANSNIPSKTLFAALVHPEDLSLINHISTQAQKKQSSYHIHHRLLMKNGKIKYIERRINLYFNANGLLERELELLKDISDEILNEQKINETTEILRAVIDTAHVAIAQLDPKMNFIFVNKTYADADDKTPEYFIGKNHFELYPNPENEEIFRNVVRTGEKYTVKAKPFEYEYSPERSISHWDWTLTPIKDINGVVTSIVLSLQNVTERVNALSQANQSKLKLHKLNERLEELVDERTSQLEEERAFTNTVLETQGALVLVLNRYGKIVLFNRACELSSEYDREEVSGQTYWDTLIDPEYRDAVIKQFDRLLETGMPSDSEGRLTTKSAKTRIIDWSSSTIKEKDSNSVYYVVMTGLDVTERRITEKLLKRTSDNLDIAQKITKIGSWEYDLTSNKLWWSDEYFNIFGYDPQTSNPSKELYLDRIHKHDREKAISATEQLQKRGYKEIILRIDVPGSETRVISEIARAEYDKNGNPTLLKGTVQDISDITKAEQERNQLQRQLQQAHKMESIGQLTGGIAHDFNNILAAILGFTRLASIRFAKDEEDTLTEYLHEIEKAGKRASSLVKQMLAFSRGDTQDFSVFDPIPVIKESTKMLRSTITSSIVLNEQLISDNLYIDSNALQLQQAIVNLILNARDAIKEKGEISIRVTKENMKAVECISCHKIFSGDHLVISVKDTGGGIDQDIISNIFEPFFTTKPVGEGTGMGLAMVHGFLHSSGGHIRLDINPGLSTIVKLYFPVVSLENQPEIDLLLEKKDANDDEGNKDKKILIVDDEPAVVKYMREYLAMHHYDVEGTTSSVDALDKIKSNPTQFNLLITDQSMPNLTGEELLHEVRKINPNLPIILNSGYSDIEDENQVNEDDGLTFYLSKPINQKALNEKIKQIFNNNI